MVQDTQAAADLLDMNVKVLDISKKEQHGMSFDGKPLKSHEDHWRLHQALDENDLDYYYSIVPEKLFEYV